MLKKLQSSLVEGKHAERNVTRNGMKSMAMTETETIGETTADEMIVMTVTTTAEDIEQGLATTTGSCNLGANNYDISIEFDGL